MHKQRWIMHTILLIGAAAVALGVGCGGGSFPLITSRLPTQLTGPDGQLITLEEIKAIAALDDPDEQRERFEDLGIEDPDLIEALLKLDSGGS